MTDRILLPPDQPQWPHYWMHESGGKLVPAMGRYLRGEAAEPDDVTLIRAYLRQWIDSPVWGGGTELDELRKKVRGLCNRQDIDMWLEDAGNLDIDPL